MTPGRTGRLYLAYSAGFLALTLLSGVWLRAAFVAPEVLMGFRFGDLLHAHSHVAFFGWTTPALCALVSAALRVPSPRDRALRVHAHLVGAVSAAAFLGFLWSGYAAHTIVLSSLHVSLWIAFAGLVWSRLRPAASTSIRFHRAAILFLVVAGAGAMLPGLVMATGVTDPWMTQMALQAFLTPFIGGWLLLGAMGAAYGRIARPRHAREVLLLTCAGTLPTAFLHAGATPPAEALTWIGRGGMVVIGLAAILFAADLLRSAGAVRLLWLGAAAAALKGLAEIAVGAGPALGLIEVRNLSIAYLHLVLLALVTPILLTVGYRIEAPRLRPTAFAAGLATMLAALVVLGWPGASNALVAIGVGADVLLGVALAGAALTAAAGVALVFGPEPRPGAGDHAARTRSASGGPAPVSPDAAAGRTNEATRPGRIPAAVPR